MGPEGPPIQHRREPRRRQAVEPRDADAIGGTAMLKVLGWAVAIIFLIGLLVVFGVLDLIF